MEKDDKKKYDTILDDPKNILGKKINIFLIILILLSVLSLILESIWNNLINYKIQFFIVDLFISSILAIEYFYRLYKNKNKILFLKSKLNFIDFISFAPFFVEIIFPWFTHIDFLKILRLFRIFKLLKYNKNIIYFFISFKNYKAEFSTVWVMIFIVLISSGFIMNILEWDINTWFRNVANSIWWAIVTMATLWYGDVVPITPIWKIFWSIVIFLWPIMFAMLSSISILVFMEVDKAKYDEIEDTLRNKEKTCSRCGYVNPIDANYCMKCWKNFRKVLVKK